MRIRQFFLMFVIAYTSLWGNLLEAFVLQYPGEKGFFIGKPMIYMVTSSSDSQVPPKEGTFIFGQSRITIDDKGYYDCVFKSSTEESHFYLGIDSVEDELTQKGCKLDSAKLAINPDMTSVDYPVFPGKSWSETVDLTAEDIEIQGSGKIPVPIFIKGVKLETKVSSSVVSVPAGTFDTLLVETSASGYVPELGTQMILIQRTWLSEDNVVAKRNFEFTKPAKLMLYELELSNLTLMPWDVNMDNSVNIVDLVIVAMNFGKQIEKVRIPNPDVDGNRAIDILDLTLVAIHFGENYYPSE